jgi:hypothetical protein
MADTIQFTNLPDASGKEKVDDTDATTPIMEKANAIV